MGQREEHDKLCSVPKVTEALHFHVDTLNQMKLSFQPPQGPSKDGEWRVGLWKSPWRLWIENSLLTPKIPFSQSYYFFLVPVIY